MGSSKHLTKKRRSQGACPVEDQYGETGISQDRDEAFLPPSSQGGLRGGGSAGRSTRREGDVVYQRQTPKFLQKYKHYLDKGTERRIENPEQKEESDEDDQFRSDHEAVCRAIEEQPSMAKELNPTIINKVKAEKEKEEGNHAYRVGDYAKAITHYTTCLELDPENPTYFSNRAAVYTANSQFDNAVLDAERAIKLKPGWVKGWARLAAARFGLKQFSDAREAYEKAINIEPHDQTLSAGYKQAIDEEERHIKANKHTFKKRRTNKETPVRNRTQSPKTVNVKISYDVDDEEGQE